MSARATALTLATVVVLAAAAWPIATRAQHGTKTPLVGWLASSTREGNAPYIRTFETRLTELGYAVGKTVIVEYRFADGQPERLVALAAEMVALKPDAIVVGSNPGVAAVRQATVAVPIVMIAGFEPIAWGFVVSLARPGSNVTGLTLDVDPETDGKRLELLRDLVPAVSRVAILRDPTFPGQESYLREIEVSARRFGLTLTFIEVRRRDELEPAFVSMARTGIGAVFVGRQPLFLAERRYVAALAVRHRLPAMYGFREFPEVGGLASYGASLHDLTRRTAGYVDRLLKGARPADLPVEQPIRFELVVNVKAAQLLGLTIPRTILLRADEVISE